MEKCDRCNGVAEYQVQFNEIWDFFFSCEEHLGELLIEEFRAQEGGRKLPIEFIVVYFKKRG
jgi:hypothetical protein